MQINRLFEIVYILLNKKQVTAKELSERFEVSTRTIYRDIDTLCEVGIPIYTNKGKGGGISLLEQFVLNKSVLSKKEQEGILTALQGINGAPYLESKEVLHKLSALFGNDDETDWIEVDYLGWQQAEKEKFELIKGAILQKKVIVFDYYNSNMEKSHRAVEPLQLCFKDKAWYLKAFCRVKSGIRLFKLTRIKELTCKDEQFVRRALNEEKTEEKVLPFREIINMTLLVDKSQAYRVFDEFSEEQITKDEMGNFIIKVSYPEGEWIYGYLLSYGPYAEVIEPTYIRSIMREKLKSAVARYEE